MNLLKKQFINSKTQSGIALIFALAILSLLLVMALAFATSSIFDQRVANNNANVSIARIIATAELSRVKDMLQAYGDGLQYSQDKQAAGGNSPWFYTFASGKRSDMLTRLNTNVITKTGTYNIYTLNTGVTWDFFQVDDGSTDIAGNGRIIGRAAYVVIPSAGIDPGACVKKGEDEGADAEERLGVDVNEINLMSLSPADINAALASKFNYTAAEALPTIQLIPGLYSGSWVDYNNLFSLLNITDGRLMSKFMKWFLIDSPTRPERYWIDRNNNGYEDNSAGNHEYYDRFNLTRTDWETNFNTAFKMYDTILLDNNNNGTPDRLPRYYDSTVHDGIGIPWLAFFGYDKDGNLVNSLGETFGNSVAGVVARRRQIAANLVDYCRVITALPTSDVNPVNWADTYPTTDPTYTGNKRTPYINEVGIKVSANINRVGGNITFSVNANIFTELINIYPALADSKAEVTVIYDYAFNAKVDGAIVASESKVNQVRTITINASDWNAGLKYSNKPEDPFDPLKKLISWSYTEILSAPDALLDKPAQITDFQLGIKKVVMAADVDADGVTNGNYDIAKINTFSSFWTPVDTVNTTPLGFIPVDGFFYLAFQANDPRQNLNKEDWWMDQTVAGGDGSVGNPYIAPNSPPVDIRTFAIKNKFNGAEVNPKAINALNPNITDKEIIEDPAYDTAGAAGQKGLSTAYINHGPIDSPWELGFIHRGAAWQTINLKEYDTNKATKIVTTPSPEIIPGGGAYSDRTNGGGDANILDQIKMSDAAATHKVNINCTYVDLDTNKNVLLQALLAKIRIGSDPATPGVGGTQIGDAPFDPNNIGLVNVITGITKRPVNTNYITRAEVANAKADTVYDLIDGTCGIVQNTDAKQEELIGKFINLTDVSGKTEYFTIIIIAQAIKDVGTPSSDPAKEIKIVKKTSSGVLVPISTKLGRFDYDATNNLYADEITGEQKIKVMIHRDSSGVCKILSYEYVE